MTTLADLMLTDPERRPHDDARFLASAFKQTSGKMQATSSLFSLGDEASTEVQILPQTESSSGPGLWSLTTPGDFCREKTSERSLWQSLTHPGHKLSSTSIGPAAPKSELERQIAHDRHKRASAPSPVGGGASTSDSFVHGEVLYDRGFPRSPRFRTTSRFRSQERQPFTLFERV